jgi:hypothetical protein
VVLAYRPIHLKELDSIISLPEELLDDMTSLEELVGLCGSFLTIREGFIYVIHQSAKDYLSTHAEPNIFPNGRMEVQCRILSRSLQAMSNTLGRDMCSLRDPGWSIEQIGLINLDPLAKIRYACIYWIEHLCEIDGRLYSEVDLCDNGTINLFLNKHLLHWLEALSLMRSMSSGVAMIRKLEDMLAVSSNSFTIPGLILNKKNPRDDMDFLSIVRDANRFILYNRSIVEEAPLQVYYSALVFSPMKSRIRDLFQKQVPSWIEPKPRVNENWSSCLQTLEGHTDWVRSGLLP